MKYLFFMYCLIAGAGATAQEMVLKGMLGFAGGESYTYELHLTEGAHGTLKGYSLLYATPGRETRASLVGLINREENNLSFTEQAIEYSHNFESKANICRLSATLKYLPHVSRGRPALLGTTGANEYSPGRCTPGTLTFTATEELQHFFETPPVEAPAIPAVADSTAKPLPQPLATTLKNASPGLPLPQPLPPVATDTTAAEGVQSIAEKMPANQKPSPRRFYFPKRNKTTKDTVAALPAVPVDTAGGLHLTAGEQAAITCSSEVLELEVWDGAGKVDGDEITVMYNERVLLSRFSLRAGHQVIRMPVGTGGQLRVVAVKEGAEKPCVAFLSLKDGDLVHRFVVSNSVGKESAISISRQENL